MKRFAIDLINLILVSLLGLGLSGCISSKVPIATTSPWKEVQLDTEGTPLDIGFVDEGHGFLVGSNRLILETNDGGATWEERSLDFPETENFRLISVDFLGEEGWIAGQPSLVMHTTDSGQNWNRLELGGKLPGEPYLITTLGAESAELATTAGAVYSTENGGKTWEANVAEASGGIRDLRRASNGDYVSASSLGNFFATLTHGEESWQPHQRASSKRVQTIGYKPDGGLWMLSRGAEIRFNNDSDDFESWDKPIIPIVNGYNYLDLGVDPGGSVWVAGGSGTLLVSRDEGESWEQDLVGSSQPSNLIRILFDFHQDEGAPGKGFVLGERGTLLRWVG